MVLIKKNISEYQFSLDSGHSQGYIQSITSERNLPSMNAFLEICAYFDITPSEFSDSTINNPSLIKNIMEYIKRMSDNDLLLFATVLKRFFEVLAFQYLHTVSTPLNIEITMQVQNYLPSLCYHTPLSFCLV